MSLVYDFADIARRMNCGKPVKRPFKPADLKAVEVLPPGQVVTPPLVPSMCHACRKHGYVVKTPAHIHSFHCNWCGHDDVLAHCSTCQKWTDISKYPTNARSCGCAHCFGIINL